MKLTFPNGVSLKDPSSLFNSGLEGNTSRAIGFRERVRVNEAVPNLFIREAVAVTGRHNIN